MYVLDLDHADCRCSHTEFVQLLFFIYRSRIIEILFHQSLWHCFCYRFFTIFHNFLCAMQTKWKLLWRYTLCTCIHMYMYQCMKYVHLHVRMQCIMSQYQFSDEERRKEFLDLLFAFLTLKGTYSMYIAVIHIHVQCRYMYMYSRYCIFRNISCTFWPPNSPAIFEMRLILWKYAKRGCGHFCAHAHGTPMHVMRVSSSVTLLVAKYNT